MRSCRVFLSLSIFHFHCLCPSCSCMHNHLTTIRLHHSHLKPPSLDPNRKSQNCSLPPVIPILICSPPLLTVVVISRTTVHCHLNIIRLISIKRKKKVPPIKHDCYNYYEHNQARERSNHRHKHDSFCLCVGSLMVAASSPCAAPTLPHLSPKLSHGCE